MSANRSLIFGTGEYYHVFNRGVEKRSIFTTKREYIRAIDTIKYYKFNNLRLKYSKYINLEKEKQKNYLVSLSNFETQVEIIAYCLMPNHFHFLLKQTKDGGVISFISKFSNSYTKYFNVKHDRVGPLFQGVFKAVHVEDDEQFLHVSRYIHLNPVVAFLVKKEELRNYLWSSFPQYIGEDNEIIANEMDILNFFKTRSEYKKFVFDQADYSLSLKKIEYLTFDEE